MLDIKSVLQSLSKHRPIFHAEADFQQSLAWEIKEHYPNCKIRLETKVFGADRKVYLDILCIHEGRKYAIELKYKTVSFNCTVDEEDFALNNQGAQDIGRYDVLKDVQRLEAMVEAGVADEGILIFLTNDRLYYNSPNHIINTVDRNFRIHDGSHISGELNWAKGTGVGTLKGRETPIKLNGNYEMKWKKYSQINSETRSCFQYLMLRVNATKDVESRIESPLVEKELVPCNIHTNTNNPFWFRSFTGMAEIILSQKDLQEKLAHQLQELGYTVQLNRVLGNEKIDVWAENDTETLAIEVRNKTALLKTMYKGNHIHLKQQGAYDISRYDFVSDLGKMERVVQSRPGVKGCVLLITNDRLYWQPPKKQNPVDESFHIHDGHVVSGIGVWKEEASAGTTNRREETIHLTGKYVIKWRPYLHLGEGKNEEFKTLFVEVG
ncbi:hypothetical protein [Sutcliffiella cohnii]|uniref:hypothetical protein n=1 Tax=Sutcliffiella cohnii TaxID=33932 RepID=UPI002E1F79A1|nr:hypothetical protein [Sutcliffiella cohnii]